MRCLVLYDIPDDRVRAKIADACLDYGLERVQWSAFIGELNQTLQRELALKLRQLVGRKAANILLLPLNEGIWQQRREIKQGDSGT